MIEQAIFELIETFTPERCYLLVAEQDANTPFSVMQRLTGTRFGSLKGPSGLEQARIQIDVYDESIYEAKRVGKQIQELLDGYKGTVTTPDGDMRIGGCSLEFNADLVDQTDDQKLFRNQAVYLVTFDTEIT